MSPNLFNRSSQPRPPCRIDSISVYQVFWRALDRLGVSVCRALNEAQLPAELQFTPVAHLTTAEFFSLIRVIDRLAADPGFGAKLLGEIDISLWPPPCLAAIYAMDYRDALQRTARYKQLCMPELMHVAETDKACTITIEWMFADRETPALLVELIFSALIALGRAGTGKHIVAQSVEFLRPDPGVEVHRTYFGCPVRYGASRDALLLNTEDLDRPFLSHNPELLRLLSAAFAAQLEAQESFGLTCGQVKVALKRALRSGRPEIAAIARELGVSARTLQRRITDEGTSFRRLLLEARQELARQYLARPDAEIGSVACLLGYEDANSFYRAFRSWEGITPAQWRDLKAPTYQ